MTTCGTSSIEISESRYPELLARLLGKAFHVSKMANYSGILKAGSIHPNPDCAYETSFGSSSNSFFKNRGCVSVFDYRNVPQEKFDQFAGRCHPLTAARDDGKMVVFVLCTEAANNLISWENWKTEEAHSEMVVPYVEAGYKGSLALTYVETILIVHVVPDPDPVVKALKRGRTNAH
jgi:hypothetical protein